MGVATILGTMESKYYFLPGNRWPWYITYRIPISVLYGSSIGILFLMTTCWYIGIYKPLIHIRHKYQERYLQLKKMYDQEEQAIHALPEIQQRCNQLAARLMPYDAPTLLHKTSLHFLDTIRIQPHVYVSSFKPGNHITQGDYMCKRVQFSVLSNFKSLLTIISYTSKFPVNYSIQTLAIQRMENGQLQVHADIEFRALRVKVVS